ncbi:hypothetical protein KCV87_32810 [Actinosynnema pretiosum subsp. pretiosum]|uniref:Uncharacterized protein n=1 Tax=Actinosynnema pretiosum subsp. pretiosum TaxID=103721 RepID=A0AA45L678_9PSEU|nr:hypothetical protein APASM_4582 [Actinosynnema pretiosum subsp. pretiosum]QUF04072.1 hypothetical protein KCV87_32810 [Actinosynnema pretiosum subsp. pretiosum]
MTIGSGPLPRPHELRFADGMVSLLHEPVDGKLGMGRLLQPTYVPMVHGLVGDGEEITLLDVVER